MIVLALAYAACVPVVVYSGRRAAAIDDGPAVVDLASKEPAVARRVLFEGSACQQVPKSPGRFPAAVGSRRQCLASPRANNYRITISPEPLFA